MKLSIKIRRVGGRRPWQWEVSNFHFHEPGCVLRSGVIARGASWTESGARRTARRQVRRAEARIARALIPWSVTPMYPPVSEATTDDRAAGAPTNTRPEEV